MTWPQPSWRERTNLYSRCLSVGRRKSMEYRGFMKVSISSKSLPITTLCGKPFWNLQKPIDSRLRVVSAPLWIECWTKRLGSLSKSEEHTSELQSHSDLVCRLLLEKEKRADHAPLPRLAHPRRPPRDPRGPRDAPGHRARAQ